MSTKVAQFFFVITSNVHFFFSRSHGVTRLGAELWCSGSDGPADVSGQPICAVLWAPLRSEDSRQRESGCHGVAGEPHVSLFSSGRWPLYYLLYVTNAVGNETLLLGMNIHLQLSNSYIANVLSQRIWSQEHFLSLSIRNDGSLQLGFCRLYCTCA